MIVSNFKELNYSSKENFSIPSEINNTIKILYFKLIELKSRIF